MTSRRWRGPFSRGAGTVPGNHVRLLQGGAEFFPALLEAIAAATREIHLETYIFNADPSALAVRDALIDAAARGVEVHLLVDGLGSRAMPADWGAMLREAGVVLRTYRPLVFGWRANPRSLRRLHRKLVVIDARIAFVGGINLIDDFEPWHFAQPRLDFSVRVEGPLLAQIHKSALNLWRLVALSQWQQGRRKPALEPTWPTDGRTRAAYLVRDNFAHRRDIERSYLAAFTRARNEIVIANAYFMPGRRFIRALKTAVRRGVRVRLLVQGHTDHPFFQTAARALYRDLLAAGVEIHRYQASELHAKVAVVDGSWATVGSSNIDPFSLLLAREANVVVEHEAFAGELRHRLDCAMREGGTQLDPADWQRQAWPFRVLTWVAYELVRMMLGLAGFRRWT